MKYSMLTIFRTLLVLILGFGLSTEAQDTKIIELSGNGSINEFTFSAADRGTRTVSFLVESTGNESEAFDLYIDAPPNTVVTSKQAILSGRDKFSILNFTNEFTPITLNLYGKSKEYNSLKIEGSSAPIAQSTSVPVYVCANLTRAQLDQVKASLKAALGRELSDEEACKILGVSSTPSNQSEPTPGVGSGLTAGVLSNGIIHKNSCGSATDSYLLKIDLDLSTIDPNLFSSGFSIKIGVDLLRYLGGKAASLKPRGDGKYRVPLGIFNALSASKQFLNIVRFKNGKPKVTKREIKKSLYYRGYPLVVGLLDGLLNGGVGTIELTDGQRMVYSHCFKMKAVRQYKADYPR